MVSTEKGSVKNFRGCPNYGDEKMMTQGSRKMNLHVHDCDDWLVINKEANVRARNNPRVAPNSVHMSWGKPAMLGRPRAGEQVPWSNYHTPNASVMYRPPNLVNINQNGMTMGISVGQPPLRNGCGANGVGGHMNSYVGMPSKDTGCVAPVIVIDSSDDEEKGDYSGGDKYVTDRKARTKGVSQGLTSDSRGRPSAIPGPYMNRVNPPSGVLRPAFGNHRWSSGGKGTKGVIHRPGTRPRSPPSWWELLTQRSGCEWEVNKNGTVVPKVKSNDGGLSTKDDFDDFSDEDVDREDDVTRANRSNQSRRPVHGQVGVAPPLKNHGSFTVHRAVQSPDGRVVIPQPGTHPLPPPSRCGWEFNKICKSIAEVKSNDGGFSTEDDSDYSDEDVDWDDDDVTQANCSHQSRHSVHGQVGVDLPANTHGSFTSQRAVQIPTGVVPPPNLNHSCNVAAGIGSSQAEAARHRGKTKACCNPLDVNGTKSTQSHDDAKEQFLKCTSRQKYQQSPGTTEGILPVVSNPISGANSCNKMSATSGGLKREILSEAESSDFDDEDDSQFDENECNELKSRVAAESFKRKSESETLGTIYEPKTPVSRVSRLLDWKMKQKCESVGTKDEQLVAESFKKNCKSSGKELEENCNVRQSSKFKDGEKEKKQCGKPLNESSEATDVCAGKLLQKETQKVAAQPNANMSVSEDCKNSVKELAKLVKSHITSKNEGDPCADVGKQVMKIHEELLEMKKRHHKEEQELLREYDAALTRFSEKLTFVDCDSDASERALMQRS